MSAVDHVEGGRFAPPGTMEARIRQEKTMSTTLRKMDTQLNTWLARIERMAARTASPRRDQKRCVYISCTFSCLCVMTMPCPLVTLLLGATVSEPLNSLAGEKR